MLKVTRLLTPLGSAAAVLALSKTHAVLNDYDYTGSFRFGFSLALIVVIAVAAYAFGLPDLTRSLKEGLLAGIKATLVAALVVSVFQFFLGDGLLPRFVVLGSPLLLVPWFGLCAMAATSGSRREAERARVFLVAGEDNRKALADDIDVAPERPALLVGSVTPDEVRGSSGQRFLEERVAEAGATMLVLDRTALVHEDIVSQVATLHLKGLKVRTIVPFYERWLGKLPITELERASLMFDIGELHRARYWRVKRLIDIVIGSIGFMMMVAVLPFVLIGNRASGVKKAIYRQPRVGKNGEEFLMYKFGTMVSDTEALSSEWTSLDDPRITRFGRFLRRAHMDELPQVINILKGELSLVGPRPEQPLYVESLSKVLPYYALRYSVTPGLTGWAQVKFGYAGSYADAREKLQYDFYYLSHQGLRLDLITVGRTLRSILGFKGR